MFKQSYGHIALDCNKYFIFRWTDGYDDEIGLLNILGRIQGVFHTLSGQL